MKFSEAWLREWVNPRLDTQQLADQLTMAGLEVDSVEPVAAEFSGVVVAEVVSVEAHPDADLMELDAVTVDTGRTFDGIYSNKVLHHLTKSQLEESMRQQARVLNSFGLLLHSFWYGDQVEEFHGLRFVYHTEASLSEAIGDEVDPEQHAGRAHQVHRVVLEKPGLQQALKALAQGIVKGSHRCSFCFTSDAIQQCKANARAR